MKDRILFSSIAAIIFVLKRNISYFESKNNHKLGIWIALIAILLMPMSALVEKGICDVDPYVVFVNSNAVEGSMFAVPLTVGTNVYRFTITSGAYTNWSLNDPYRPPNAGWYSGVKIYKNRPIKWTPDPNNSNIFYSTNADYVLGNTTIPFATYGEAQNNAMGVYIDIQLNEGEYVIFLSPDGKCGIVDDPNDTCGYGDNIGGMYVSVQIQCNFSTEPGIERCFGGLGTQCEGDAPYVPPFTQAPIGCFIYGWMSAGSILHDKCCLESGNTGYMCATGNKKTKVCRAEFFLATADVIGLRYWAQEFGPYPVGNKGDDTETNLTVPPGERVHKKYEPLCASKRCRVDEKGRTLIYGDPPFRYCICE